MKFGFALPRFAKLASDGGQTARFARELEAAGAEVQLGQYPSDVELDGSHQAMANHLACCINFPAVRLRSRDDPKVGEL